jgi:phage terminase large subunit-like protein
MACQRQHDDLHRRRFKYRFDRDRANRVCRFIEGLPHIKGEWAGDLIVLEPWQCFILTTVFGWIDARGRRRFKTAYIEVPRKNAKSTITSGVGLYLVSADGEAGAEVYSAATTREQAGIVWKDARAMANKTPALREDLGIATTSRAIFVAETASSFKALSRDQQGNLDGLNVHGGLLDEIHAMKDRGMWDVIETATGARAQPLLWAITTAGSNRAGICYEQRLYVLRLLQKIARDNEYFGIVYTIDEGDAWDDEAGWIKANPNWGVSVRPDDMRRKARKAMQMAAAQNNFLTKHLNVWVNADTAWMNMAAWDKCADPTLDIEDFAGKQCIAACDLATKTDIAPVAKVFEYLVDDVRHYAAFVQYFLPEIALEDGRNSQYSGWEREGRLTTTPGDVTDFGFIEEHLRETAQVVQLDEVAFDPWQAAQIMQRLTVDGMPVIEYRQTVQNMSEPMKELEALVLQGRFHFDGDPVLTWMISNVVAHIDAKENIYPRKERPENKIDGAVAVIMALGRYLVRDAGQVIGADYKLVVL